MAAECFIVICQLGPDESETGEAEYTLATRTTFPTRDAAAKYAATVNRERKPIVVLCPLGLTR